MPRPLRWQPLAALVVIAASCARVQTPTVTPTAASEKPIVRPAPAELSSVLGVVSTPSPSTPCFAGAELPRRAQVLVFEDGDQPVARLRASGLHCSEERGPRHLEPPAPTASALSGSRDAMAVATLGVGVVVDGTFPVAADGRVDLDGDGRFESFMSCTSSEGVHLTVWSGPVNDGTRLWHRYVYLGSDTEPTCSAAEMAP